MEDHGHACPRADGVPELVYLNLKAKEKRTEEEESKLRNLELLLAPDSKLRSWFALNRGILERLCNLTRTSGSQKSADINALVNRLHVDGVERQHDGTVLIVIGGILDNTVGFLFSPTNKPPPIDPSNYIWIEQVTEGWFLFRTT